MALFKIFNNIDSGTTALPATYTKGYMYFDATKGLFYIDTAGEGGTEGTRMAVNSWGALKAENDNFTTTATPYGQPIANTYIKDLNFDHNNLIFTKGDGTTAVTSFNLTILSYGHSTWDEFMAAFQTDALMYCRASSNANPATGDQSRYAFMAYVGYKNSQPSSVEFQYYRSRSTHSYAEQADQVFVYTLTKNNTTGTWAVKTRPTFPQIVAGDGLSYTYNNDILTLNTNITGDLIFKGTVDAQNPLPTTHTSGWTYKVGTAGTYAGQACEVGDTIYCINTGTTDTTADWAVVQTNIDGAVVGPASSTIDNIATFTGTTGKAIKDSGISITTTNPNSNANDTTIPTSKAVWDAITGASGYGKTGTVTNIAASGSGGITISGSPITTSGTLSIELNLSEAINGLEKENSNLSRNDYIISENGNEVNGSIATFEANSEEPIKKIIVNIEPVQEGSGDPSPTNIRPISGWTGCRISRCGFNLFDGHTSNSITSNDGSETIVQSGRSTGLIPVPFDRILIVPTYADGITPPLNSGIRIVRYDSNKQFINRAIMSSENVISSPQDVSTCSYVKIQWFVGEIESVIIKKYDDPSGERGDSYPCSWETEAGTVYYGSLNIKTGVMTVEGGINIYDGVNSVNVQAPEGGVVNLGKVTDIGRAGPDYYSFYTTNIRIGNFGSSAARILTPQEMSDGGFLCSNMPLCTMFEAGDPTTNAEYAVGARLTAAGNVRVHIYARADTGITTVDAMNAKLAEWYENNTPFAYCFRLRTPFTVQLTPGQLFSTLYGVNNIWADCGDVDIVYTDNNSIYKRKKIGSIFSTLNNEDITNALGYIPYNSINPNGYVNNIGTGATGTWGISISGNAAIASKVSHKLTFGNGTFEFDGSADVNVPVYTGAASWGIPIEESED